MEMKDLGKKNTLSNVGEDKNRVYYPEASFEQKVMPGLKDKNVGDTIKLVIEARVCGISEYKNGEVDYRLEFRKAAIQDKAESK